MRSRRALALLGAVLVAGFLAGQNVNMEHPENINVQHRLTPEEMRDRLSGTQLQKDAKDLGDLCASIPADMDGIRQGMLAKDLLEKLKRVEKLSKRVREELASAAAAAK